MHGPAGLGSHAHPGGAGQLPGGEVDGELVLGEAGRRCCAPARPCRRSPGPGRGRGPGPRTGRPGRCAARPGVSPAASRSAVMSPVTLASGALAGGDAHGRDQAGVQVAQHVPLVAVEQHRAGLAPVAHLGVLDADPPVFGHPAAQRRRRPGAVHVLVAHLAGDRHRCGRGLVTDWPATKASTRSSKPSTWARARSRAAGSSQSRSSAAFRLEAASGGTPACAATTRSLRPAPAPAGPRSRPGPCAGRVPSS